MFYDRLYRLRGVICWEICNIHCFCLATVVDTVVHYTYTATSGGCFIRRNVQFGPGHLCNFFQ